MEENTKGLGKNTHADVTNLGSTGSWGSASTAAGFLSKFIEEPTKWLHLDMYGPSIRPTGATGFGTRTAINYVLKSVN